MSVRELQAIIQQRDSQLQIANGEIEERENLLHKTKQAIEQLQVELDESRRENNLLRTDISRHKEDQTVAIEQAEDTISDLQLRLQAGNSATKELQQRAERLQLLVKEKEKEKEDAVASGLLRIKDKEKRITTLQSELDDAHKRETIMTQESRSLEEKMSKLKSQLRDATLTKQDSDERIQLLREEGQVMLRKLEEVRKSMSQLQQSHDSLQEQLQHQQLEREAAEKSWAGKLHRAEEQKREEMQELQRQLRELQDSHTNSLSSSEREWVMRSHEVKLHWEKRLKDGMMACEQKFNEEAIEWQAKLKTLDLEWQSHAAEVEHMWAKRLSDEQQAISTERALWDIQIQDIRAQALQDSNVKVQEQMQALILKHQQDLASMEKSWSERLERMEATWSQRHEESQKRWAADSVGREEQWALRLGDIQSDHAVALASKEAEMKASHQKELDAAKLEFDKEVLRTGSQLTEERVKAQEEAERLMKDSAERYSVLQVETALKAAALTECISDLSHRETVLEASRTHLIRQLEEIQDAYSAETRRHLEAETDLRDQLESHRNQLRLRGIQMDDSMRELREARLQRSLAQVSVSSASPGHYTSATFEARPAGSVLQGQAPLPAMLSSSSTSAIRHPAPSPPPAPLLHNTPPRGASATLAEELLAARAAREEALSYADRMQMHSGVKQGRAEHGLSYHSSHAPLTVSAFKKTSSPTIAASSFEQRQSTASTMNTTLSGMRSEAMQLNSRLKEARETIAKLTAASPSKQVLMTSPSVLDAPADTTPSSRGYFLNNSYSPVSPNTQRSGSNHQKSVLEVNLRALRTAREGLVQSLRESPLVRHNSGGE
ncbi:hypothetical protein CEUSTIGMA_g2752.t1 [Chlamydomonas eustigma]|uniref:Uncharacterized protein n=1 Tax=Chlamydomonas eustigma TaxID=1157962 RepID=A0A250WWU2_9CHLO|nr:hypothetical protein CEUSTIGMA_g2752.t1 [Chlamydomonas eustigma]|eukprot:GAX75307.1 hypothetical protein CEUSTIGMA_g2752.t1 [Chlamydomonas eustigma]